MVVTLQPYFNTSHSPFIEKLHKKRIKNIFFIPVSSRCRRGISSGGSCHRSGLYHRLARTASASLWCIFRLQILSRGDRYLSVRLLFVPRNNSPMVSQSENLLATDSMLYCRQAMETCAICAAKCLDWHWIMLKMLYFQRKHKENYAFPLVIETFLLYLQRILIK